MGLRCREGDQAIVLAGPYIGFIVKVAEFVGDKTAPNTSGRIVNAEHAWRVRNRDIEREQFPYKVLMEDKNLQPLRGPKTGQTTTTEKEMKA